MSAPAASAPSAPRTDAPAEGTSPAAPRPTEPIDAPAPAAPQAGGGATPAPAPTDAAPAEPIPAPDPGLSAIAPESVRACGCGCGSPVARRYLPGHDARHKAAIVAQAEAATTPSAREAAVRLADSLGWASFIPLAILRATPIRHGRKIRTHIEDVERFLVDCRGEFHSRHACNRLTQSVPPSLRHPITKLAPQAMIIRVDSTPALLADLRSDWFLCPECTCDERMDEIVESNLVGRAIVLDALDSESLTLGGAKAKLVKRAAAKVARAAKPRTWTLIPDPLPPLVNAYEPTPFLHPAYAA